MDCYYSALSTIMVYDLYNNLIAIVAMVGPCFNFCQVF